MTEAWHRIPREQKSLKKKTALKNPEQLKCQSYLAINIVINDLGNRTFWRAMGIQSAEGWAGTKEMDKKGTLIFPKVQMRRKEEGSGQGKVMAEGWLVGFLLRALRTFIDWKENNGNMRRIRNGGGRRGWNEWLWEEETYLFWSQSKGVKEDITEKYLGCLLMSASPKFSAFFVWNDSCPLLSLAHRPLWILWFCFL